MLGILLGILKCIGFLILGLFLLILTLVLIVLFTPIQYRLQGMLKEKLQGTFTVGWLFGILRVQGAYVDGSEPTITIYLFGRSLTAWAEKRKARKKKKKKRKKKSAQQKKRPTGEGVLVAREKPTTPDTPHPKAKVEIKEIKVEEAKIEEIEVEEIKTEEVEIEELKTEEIKTEEVEIEEIKTEELKEPEEKSVILGQTKAAPISKAVRRIKLSEIQEKPPEITVPLAEDKFFFEEETAEEKSSKRDKLKAYWAKFQEVPQKKEIFAACKKLLKRLMKGILPKNLSIQATLGTGDPVYTGYLMGLVGILTAKFGESIQIKGEFTRLVAEDIEVHVKGRIIVGSFIYAVLAFVLTKPVRKLLIKLWKGR